MAQYIIKDSFASVIITGAISNNILKVFVISDMTKTIYDVNATIQVYSWKSFKPVYETTVVIHLVKYT